MISYKPLWKTLIDKEIAQKDLANLCNLTRQTVADMKNNKSVSLKTIEKICQKLNCTIPDIIEYINDK